MFVWAKALLEDQEHLSSWIASRFPFVIFDEVQDTSENQALFLDSLFPRTSNQVIVQRVGDPNQEIFDRPEMASGESESFPDQDNFLEIPNSYRFGSKIASFASPFAVRPIGTEGLSGIGPKELGDSTRECKHTIFVFPDDRTDGVLEAFGRHVLTELGDSVVSQGAIAAVGHIHTEDPKVSPGHKQYPKSVGDYWSGYSVAVSHRDSSPSTLAHYVAAAQGLVVDGRSLSPGVEKIAAATVDLAKRMGTIGDLKRKVRTHRAILEILEGEAALLGKYRTFLSRFLVQKAVLTEAEWPTHVQVLTEVATALCHGNVDRTKANEFLAWPADDLAVDKAAGRGTGDGGGNVILICDGVSDVEIQLGSIHSVKGQTHLATLLLSTYWHDHSVKTLLPWLLGKKSNGASAGRRIIHRLLHTYVALTRPSHMVCLAVPCSTLGSGQVAEENIATLRQIGWEVAEIADGAVKWRV